MHPSADNPVFDNIPTPPPLNGNLLFSPVKFILFDGYTTTKHKINSMKI